MSLWVIVIVSLGILGLVCVLSYSCAFMNMSRALFVALNPFFDYQIDFLGFLMHNVGYAEQLRMSPLQARNLYRLCDLLIRCWNYMAFQLVYFKCFHLLF